jgi:hypothetical protein
MFEEATENRKHVFLYIQFCSFAKYCVWMQALIFVVIFKY